MRNWKFFYWISCLFELRPHCSRRHHAGMKGPHSLLREGRDADVKIMTYRTIYSTCVEKGTGKYFIYRQQLRMIWGRGDWYEIWRSFYLHVWIFCRNRRGTVIVSSPSYCFWGLSCVNSTGDSTIRCSLVLKRWETDSKQRRYKWLQKSFQEWWSTNGFDGWYCVVGGYGIGWRFEYKSGAILRNDFEALQKQVKYHSGRGSGT